MILPSLLNPVFARDNVVVIFLISLKAILSKSPEKSPFNYLELLITRLLDIRTSLLED